MDEKPGLYRYLKTQNDPYYKITGVIKGENGGRTFYEVNCPRNKCIIDAVLSLICYTLLAAGFIIYESLNLRTYNNIGYDPYSMFKGLAYGVVFFLLWVPFIVPVISRLLRQLFGLRWFRTEFTVELPGEKNGYIMFYNNCIMKKMDFTLKKEEKENEDLLYEQYKNNINANRRIFKAIKALFIIIYCILTFSVILLYALNLISIGFACILFIIGFAFFYGLSHAAAYFFWNRGKDKAML